MNLKGLVVIILYTGFSFGALLFVSQTARIYMKGSSDYSVRHETISLLDLPTITVCWNLFGVLKNRGIVNYGQDFLIDVKIFERKTKTVTLKANRSVETLYGINIHMTEVWTEMKEYNRVEQQCFMISSKWNGSEENEMVDLQEFGVKLVFKFSNTSEAHTSGCVRLTSEANAYGLAGGRWFDGKVYKTCIATGWLLRIVEVTEYINLESTCSHDSYYQCLSN